MKRFLIAGVALAALSFAGSAAFAEPIVLDMKGPGAGNPFWAAVQAGAEEKGKELGVEVVVMSPPAESDVQAQIGQLEDMLAKGIAGLALAPTDPNALAPVVDAAKAKNVPVVFVDTKGTNEGVTFIGTNNEVGAKLAATSSARRSRRDRTWRSCRASSRNRPVRRALTAPKPGSKVAASRSSPSSRRIGIVPRASR